MKRINQEKNGRILIIANSAWNLFNFRSELIKSLIDKGYEVIALAPPDKFVNKVTSLGCGYIPLQINRKGINPISDLILLCRFFFEFQKIKPDFVLTFTIKPNIYGSIAAQILGITVINNISGLGSVFIKNGLLASLVKILYKIALSKSKHIFFQNEDDRDLFCKYGLVNQSNSTRLPGSGIDLEFFSAINLPEVGQKIKFLLIARILCDKGVREFVDAARMLKKIKSNLEFCILGPIDLENPSAIPLWQIDVWVAEGIINYLGELEDVRGEIALAHCIVLPSYREGVPRSLLEAAAMMRPIIASDVPGCRDVVSHGLNGYLCKPKDYLDLADMMLQIAQMPYEDLKNMGVASRDKVVREFDINIVLNKYFLRLQQN